MDNIKSNRPPSPLKTLLIDDHSILRSGIKELLSTEPDIKVVAEAGDGQQGLELAIMYEPDLIILDLDMPILNGLETLKKIKANGLESKVIIFTYSDLEMDIIETFRAGADGYLLKDIEPSDFIKSIKSVYSVSFVASLPIIEICNSDYYIKCSKKVVNSISSLSHREIDVLKLMSNGFSNKLISQELFISVGTVKIHVKNILRKLSLKSRVEVAVWAHNRTIN
ncbi:response regulator [Aeromonas veronii]|jgi:two-component system nitrate/nitrite response regulator NarL|uniref:response regulator n=1 Tax=Aeromonas veronii TaxID=654 RepID=UPI001A8C24DC|nr:response regulator [Aeromonas veronii]MBO0397157.1 response regulator [Aeromonas veronii]